MTSSYKKCTSIFWPVKFKLVIVRVTKNLPTLLYCAQRQRLPLEWLLAASGNIIWQTLNLLLIFWLKTLLSALVGTNSATLSQLLWCLIESWGREAIVEINHLHTRFDAVTLQPTISMSLLDAVTHYTNSQCINTWRYGSYKEISNWDQGCAVKLMIGYIVQWNWELGFDSQWNFRRCR